jgi:UDP-glucose 4-epimerase
MAHGNVVRKQHEVLWQLMTHDTISICIGSSSKQVVKQAEAGIRKNCTSEAAIRSSWDSSPGHSSSYNASATVEHQQQASSLSHHGLLCWHWRQQHAQAATAVVDTAQHTAYQDLHAESLHEWVNE